MRTPLAPTSRSGTEDDALAGIRLHNVWRSFEIGGTQTSVLEDVTFGVEDGSIVSIVGPNGSGKSTLLRLVAGLLMPERGTVEVAGQHVAEADPRVGLVFQEPRLLPWRRAVDNVSFPLELSGMDGRRRRERAQELLGVVGLERFGDAYPHELSGGMRQRLAIARALARDPQVLLLDEPFSALDALTRERFNVELLRLWQRMATTIVLVTHSIPEAVFLSDRVLVLSPQPGRIVADVEVGLPRPRAIDALDGAAFSRTAAVIRSRLAADESGTEGNGAAQQVPAAVEEAGSPAWFDPFRGAD